VLKLKTLPHRCWN